MTQSEARIGFQDFVSAPCNEWPILKVNWSNELEAAALSAPKIISEKSESPPSR
jgi:hypothetical protein